jgi:histidine triad (HIT) family protein
VHLIPLQAMEDIQFNKKIKLESDEFVAIAKAISSNL